MTEEQMGGTAPAAEATASTDSPASDETVATVAVADEPATNESSSNGAAPEGSLTATTDGAGSASDDAGSPGADVDETADDGDDVVVAPITGEDVEVDQAPAAEVPAPETSIADERDVSQASTAEAQAPTDVAAAPAPRPAPRPARTGPEPTTMEELLAEEDTEIRSFKHGDVVEGNVVRIDKDEILVDIGAKSEGVVSNRELFGRNTETQPQLSIGDTVLVYVLQPESPEGHVVLSLRRAGLERKWRAMQEQFEAGVIIEAPVIDHNKGGLIVDCGIRGFVPISQIVDFPRRPQNDQPRDAAQEIAEKLQPYVGRKLRLKILEVNRKANRLILSEKVALYEERREKRDELFSSLQVAQKVTGTVRSIAPFGVFIDLGGIDGLVHKSELSWNKVNNPEAGYKIGDEVEAEVIDINHERGRISLSIRRLQPDPWESTVADFNVGDIIDGTVTKLVNFGAFVRVREGLEGLIHISELSHQRVAHPGDVVHEGQQLKLKIISLESERHRLGLSLKQAEEPTARVATEAPAAAGRERSERRPRGERAYSAHDAVQEPEGGIDNTLAAAFAQVREQLAASEASTEPAPPATTEPHADATGWATDDAAAGTEPSGELDQPAPGDVPENASQIADVAANGALTVGPDTSTEAISNSSEPAPEAAREREDAADGTSEAGAPEAPAPESEAAAPEPEAVRAAEAEAAGE
ncbi:MAG TPA: 30S ribosomal protein S1 [Candidatus Limnocylindrales bacterium]|nr:30S ribosomal protein S1 [Candidatus Limnocylindrales bacterium]